MSEQGKTCVGVKAGACHAASGCDALALALLKSSQGSPAPQATKPPLLARFLPKPYGFSHAVQDGTTACCIAV